MREVERLPSADALTPAQLAGQMLAVGLKGPHPDANIRALVQEGGVGGVIYFRRNVRTADQVAALSAALQALAAIPLLIAIDQEGGVVTRLPPEVINMPGAMAHGATGQPDLAQQTARATARQLRALGINWNYAPVADVNNNPRNPVIGVRSYGEDPERVAAFVTAAVRGYQAGGVAACAKHFPGHGDTEVDSHLDLPTVTHHRERLEAVELKPFRAAIAAGVASIMTAHVRFPAVAADGLPATLSRAALTGLLRGELGYQGLIITDCMEMKAVADRWPQGEAAVLAALAGADMILISHTPERQREALAALTTAIETGRLPLEQARASVRRVLAVKASYALPRAAPAPDTAAARSLAQGVARAAVTVVRRGRGLPLPAAAGPVLLVTSQPQAASLAEDERTGSGPVPGRPAAPRSALALGLAVVGAQELVVPADPAADDIAAALAASERAGTLVLITHSAWRRPLQAELVRRVAQRARARDVPVMLISLRDPYDLALVPEADTLVTAYDEQPATLQALADVVCGRVEASGQLPVTVPGLS